MLLQCSSVNTEIKTLIQQSHRWDWAWSWRWTPRGCVTQKPSLLPEPKSHEPFWLRCLQEVSRSISARVQVSFELFNGLFFCFFFRLKTDSKDDIYCFFGAAASFLPEKPFCLSWDVTLPNTALCRRVIPPRCNLWQ